MARSSSDTSEPTQTDLPEQPPEITPKNFYDADVYPRLVASLKDLPPIHVEHFRALVAMPDQRWRQEGEHARRYRGDVQYDG